MDMDGRGAPLGPRPSLLEMFPRLQVLEEHDSRYVRSMGKCLRRAREFAERAVKPQALDLDERVGREPRHFDWDLVREGGKYGLLSLAVPEVVGGQGFRTAHFSVAMEELSAACSGVATVFGAHALGIGPVVVGGNLAHWETALREVVRGEKRGDPVLFSLAITEPGAGSDVEDPDFMPTARIATEAKRVGGGYRLRGTKCFISNGSVARYVTIALPVDPRRPLETWTGFLVDTRSPGFSVGRVESKMGQRACPAAELRFDDVFVPEENRLGLEGDAMPATLVILAASRGPVGAIATGTARGAYEAFADYASSTRVNGHLLADEQRIQVALAEMAASIHLARQAYLDASMVCDLAIGRPMGHPLMKLLGAIPAPIRTSRFWLRRMSSPRALARIRALAFQSIAEGGLTRMLGLSSLAKVTGSDAAVAVARRALELAGPGDSEHHRRIEKCLRDAKLTQIYEGTNQINRLMMFKTLCRPGASPEALWGGGGRA